jgi:hypothetical protein
MLCGSEKWAKKKTNAPVEYFRGGRRRPHSYNCAEKLGTNNLRNFFPAGIKHLKNKGKVKLLCLSHCQVERTSLFCAILTA